MAARADSTPFAARLRSAAPWLLASVLAIALFASVDADGIVVEAARVALYGWLGFEALSRLFGRARRADADGA